MSIGNDIDLNSFFHDWKKHSKFDERTAPLIEDIAPFIENTAPLVERTAPLIEHAAPIVKPFADIKCI